MGACRRQIDLEYPPAAESSLQEHSQAEKSLAQPRIRGIGIAPGF